MVLQHHVRSVGRHVFDALMVERWQAKHRCSPLTREPIGPRGGYAVVVHGSLLDSDNGSSPMSHFRTDSGCLGTVSAYSRCTHAHTRPI